MSGTDDRDGLASTVAAEADGLASTVVGEPSSGAKVDPFGRTTASAEPTDGPKVQVGASIGRYRLEQVIGAGGMGVVYRASDDTLGRRVAVKVMRGDRDDHERLLREARTMAQLAHPGVVPVLDVVETDDGDVHIVMELVEGGTLGKWLRQARRPWRDVIDRFVPAGRALGDAHKAGVIHRDFKPDNVLIAKDGRILVSDFGLAHGVVRTTGVHRAVESSHDDLDLTRSGAVLGTPAYMAPEQFRGDDVDGRCDQFAFCVSIWEGLFGERPFAVDASTSPRSALDSLKDEVLSGRRRAPPRDHAVPARLVRALARGLETEPASRWPDLPALLAELDAIRAHRSRAPLIAGAAIGVVALGAVAVFALTRGGGSKPGAHRDAGPPVTRRVPHRVAKATPTLELPYALSDLHLSADGTVALASPGPERLVTVTAAGAVEVHASVRLYGGVIGADGVAYALTREPDGEHARVIAADGTLGDGPMIGPVASHEVAIGPDGQSVVLATQAGVALPDGWQTPATDVRALAISPDGHLLAMANVEAGTTLISLLTMADGQVVAREALTSGDLPSIAWLGDVVVVATSSGLDSYTLEELATDGGALHRLGTVGLGTGFPVALAAGDGGVAIATSGSRATLIRGAPGALTARAMTGEPRAVLGALADGSIVVLTTAATSVAVAADGTTRGLAVPTGCVPIGTYRDDLACAMPGAPLTVHAGAGTIATLPDATALDRGACTADGTTCAFAGTAKNGDPETWLVTSDGVRALGAGGVGAGTVAISPSGTVALADCSELVLVVQRGEVRELPLPDAVSCGAAFLDDGRLAIAAMDPSSNVEVRIVDVASGKVVAREPTPVGMVQSIVAVNGELAFAGSQLSTRVERLSLAD